MTYLLDTNVVSELRKRRPDPNVVAWFRTTRSADLYLSVLTLGEIRLAVESLRRRDAVQADRIGEWLDGLRMTYRDHLIDIDEDVADEWGRLNVPDPLPVVDGLLAASAKVRGWTLATRNVADLQRSGVQLFNPFEPLKA
jgi:toxin FitB